MKLHGYRYGRARFDLFPLPFSEKRGRTVLNQDSSNNVDGGDNLSCFLIKDLRTKPKKFEEGSVEESAQSTPPDIDLFVDTKEAEENGNPNVGFVPEKQSNKIDQKNSRIKSFLRPCFRVKLFKAPGSFSYRRLLPYLMDISEENSYTARKLESGPEIMDINHEIILLGTQLCPHSTSGSFLRKNDKQALSPPSSSKVSNDAKPIEADSLHQKLSLHATSFCLNISAPAFEFSRNQMQDGGQVSSDLIKELPCIRNMLEKSPFSTNGHALISACQVKEVFQKASKAEAPARSRLSKMNFNPSIHCRVTVMHSGTRVRFANDIEEKVIAKSDLPR
ncbi:hypothetical protein KPL71_026336 [Citrus sinensis]|uniref:Uncharacterized protein n=1 Tax=Citrus sinensis TaxID=2711 RepID=A0ACB8HYV8_CITSI|nr:hypothetical protein KPL71_026336 [Citrus sinensis]